MRDACTITGREHQGVLKNTGRVRHVMDSTPLRKTGPGCLASECLGEWEIAVTLVDASEAKRVARRHRIELVSRLCAPIASFNFAWATTSGSAACRSDANWQALSISAFVRSGFFSSLRLAFNRSRQRRSTQTLRQPSAGDHCASERR